MKIDKNTVFLITRESSLPVHLDGEFGSTLFYEGELDENILGILAPCICTKCSTPNVLFSLEGSYIVEVELRQMGAESYFICEAFGKCSNCESPLHAEFLFSEYAHSVTFINVEEQDNCEPYFVGNLKFVAEQFALLLTKQSERDEELDLLIDKTKSSCCRILVEGKDDKFILDSFLSKAGLIRSEDYYIFSGLESGNGFQAVKTAVHLLKELKTEFPFIALVDSDNKLHEHKQLLRNAGASDDEVFVLKKGEIEDYLIDSKALSVIIGKPEDDVREAINKTSLSGKELLNRIFNHFQLPRPKSETKKTIAEKIIDIPDEIQEIIEKVRHKSMVGYGADLSWTP